METEFVEEIIHVEPEIPPLVPKRAFSCSFCHEPGHNFRNCTHPSAKNLIQKTEEIFIINMFLLVENDYLKHHLQKRTIPELKILANHVSIHIPPSKIHQKKYYIDKLLGFGSAYYIDEQNPRESVPSRLRPEYYEKLNAMSMETIESYLLEMGQIWPQVYYDSLRCVYNTLRQTRKHSVLIVNMTDLGVANSKYLSVPNDLVVQQKLDEYTCAICLDNINIAEHHVTLNCNHTFCTACVMGNFDYLNKAPNIDLRCAVCRTKTFTLSFKDPHDCFRARIKYGRDLTDYAQQSILDNITSTREMVIRERNVNMLTPVQYKPPANVDLVVVPNIYLVFLCSTIVLWWMMAITTK